MKAQATIAKSEAYLKTCYKKSSNTTKDSRGVLWMQEAIKDLESARSITDHQGSGRASFYAAEKSHNAENNILEYRTPADLDSQLIEQTSGINDTGEGNRMRLGELGAVFYDRKMTT